MKYYLIIDEKNDTVLSVIKTSESNKVKLKNYIELTEAKYNKYVNKEIDFEIEKKIDGNFRVKIIENEGI